MGFVRCNEYRMDLTSCLLEVFRTSLIVIIIMYIDLEKLALTYLIYNTAEITEKQNPDLPIGPICIR